MIQNRNSFGQKKKKNHTTITTEAEIVKTKHLAIRIINIHPTIKYRDNNNIEPSTRRMIILGRRQKKPFSFNRTAIFPRRYSEYNIILVTVFVFGNIPFG
jgi:hypothetical protein